MHYGAGAKGLLWKIACGFASFCILAVVLAAGDKSIPLGETVTAAIALICIAFALTIPVGLRRGRPLVEPSGTGFLVGGWGIVGLLLFVFVVAFKLAVFVGDILYTTIWNILYGLKAVLAWVIGHLRERHAGRYQPAGYR